VKKTKKERKEGRMEEGKERWKKEGKNKRKKMSEWWCGVMQEGRKERKGPGKESDAERKATTNRTGCFKKHKRKEKRKEGQRERRKEGKNKGYFKKGRKHV
jgi:hypothetical protein